MRRGALVIFVALVVVLALVLFVVTPTAAKSKIAVINTLKWHYECVGHVLEYAIDHGVHVDVYMHEEPGWEALYVRLGLLTRVRPVGTFRAENYRHVFAMNAVDMDAVDLGTVPATYIAHVADQRHPRATQVHLRPLALSAADWVVPVHRICTADEKMRALSPRVSVALIGGGWIMSVSQLRSIFTNFDEIDLHFICRSVPSELRAPNITVHESVAAEDMVRVVMQSHYVASPIGGVYDHSQLSGCVPLALSTLTRVLISATQNATLRLDSALVFDGPVPALGPVTAADVSSSLVDRDRMIEHRDAVYTGRLARAIPKTRFCTGPFAEPPGRLGEILAHERALSADFELRYFDDAARDAYVKLHFPQFLSHYRNLVPGAYQADVWRLMVICLHGGVYADIGARFAAPLSTIVRPSDELILCVDTPTDPAGICNAFIAARPGHPALRLAIENVVRTRLEPRNKGAFTLDIAGPQALGRAMRIFLYGDDDGRPFVPGDYGTHRMFDYRVPTMFDERGVPVVSTFKFEGYYDVMYNQRGLRHYYPLWHSDCVFRDRSAATCERS